jgi:D-glycero-D-manno-heptose 1,7-bisphosphate phosphatase
VEGLGRPTQAVILAGGRGTRLRPITDTRPKPMVEIHGKPFLEYIVEMLRDQGFERILLLLGYLPEVIRNHFEHGHRWGVEIEYSVTGPDDLTGHRMKVASELLDPCFLLLYCDNYWPMRMDEMWDRFAAADVPAMVTVYSNRDRYSRDSVRVAQDGYVEVFDRSRKSPGLEGIEISYALLKRSVLGLLPEEDALFEEAVYPQLVEQRKLLAYVSDHRYYSVGSLERLPATERFLARKPAVILDRDGVLNKRPRKAEYVRSPEEFEWLPGAKGALRVFGEAGYRVIVVSNQAGIGRGAMTEADLMRIHERMKYEAAAEGGWIDALYYCPHDWDEGCKCRKPRPGMLFDAQRDFDLDLTRTPFIGDDERDEQAADAAGCPALLVSDQKALLDFAHELTRDRLEQVA